ncbi:MAG: hypothetical protein LPH21_02995, partial [Shewanella sp.]|nr:hypothetical protein [Shewanella sp.]
MAALDVIHKHFDKSGTGSDVIAVEISAAELTPNAKYLIVCSASASSSSKGELTYMDAKYGSSPAYNASHPRWLGLMKEGEGLPSGRPACGSNYFAFCDIFVADQPTYNIYVLMDNEFGNTVYGTGHIMLIDISHLVEGQDYYYWKAPSTSSSEDVTLTPDITVNTTGTYYCLFSASVSSGSTRACGAGVDIYNDTFWTARSENERLTSVGERFSILSVGKHTINAGNSLSAHVRFYKSQGSKSQPVKINDFTTNCILFKEGALGTTVGWSEQDLNETDGYLLFPETPSFPVNIGDELSMISCASLSIASQVGMGAYPSMPYIGQSWGFEYAGAKPTDPSHDSFVFSGICHGTCDTTGTTYGRFNISSESDGTTMTKYSHRIWVLKHPPAVTSNPVPYSADSTSTTTMGAAQMTAVQMRDFAADIVSTTTVAAAMTSLADIWKEFEGNFTNTAAVSCDIDVRKFNKDFSADFATNSSMASSMTSSVLEYYRKAVVDVGTELRLSGSPNVEYLLYEARDNLLEANKRYAMILTIEVGGDAPMYDSAHFTLTCEYSSNATSGSGVIKSFGSCDVGNSAESFGNNAVGGKFHKSPTFFVGEITTGAGYDPLNDKVRVYADTSVFPGAPAPSICRQAHAVFIDITDLTEGVDYLLARPTPTWNQTSRHIEIMKYVVPESFLPAGGSALYIGGITACSDARTSGGLYEKNTLRVVTVEEDNAANEVLSPALPYYG